MCIYSRYLFPRVINFMMAGDNFVEQRRALLANVSGETLEIGFGTGLNLPYYPKSLDHLTIVDVNPGMLERARGQIDASPIDVEAKVLNGESLPMPENTFDSVVSTWTLCSIPGDNGPLFSKATDIGNGEYACNDGAELRKEPYNEWGYALGCGYDFCGENQDLCAATACGLTDHTIPKQPGYEWGGECSALVAS